MYNYENGIKRNNIGYVRVEVRDGQCKITISIKALSLNKSSLKVYILNRDSDKLRCVYLGDLLINNSNSEMRITTNSENIMNSNLSLDSMGGMIVYADSNKFFATEWDDNPILVSEIEEALRIEYNEAEKIIEEIKKEKIELKVQPEIEKANKDIKDIKDIREVKNIKNTKEVKKDLNLEKNNFMRLQEDIKAAEKKPLRTEKKVIDRGEKVVPIKGKVNIIKEKLNPIETERGNNNYKDSNESRFPIDYEFFDYYGKNRKKIKKETIDKETVDKEVNADKNSRERPNQKSLRIFDQYPAIYPFEDNEVLECVRIEPRDIGILPMESWILGNNSFLLHGYYNFRHLIFARRKKDNRDQYILGVPGTYENREKFIANMFGFDEFKTAKMKMFKTGEFGYWFIEIKM